MNRKHLSGLILLLTVLAVGFGIYYRVLPLSSRSLEYDEVWTLKHYLELPFFSVFSDLATPNNHCLNTILIQWSCHLFGVEFWAIRLPVFLFGVLTLLLSVFCTNRLLKDRGAELFTAVWIAFSGLLIHYSNTARGYSIQVFFILLTAVMLLILSRKNNSLWVAPTLFIASVCTCLTVPSGLVFVCALYGAYVSCLVAPGNWKEILKEQRGFLIAGTAFLIFAGLWYGMNYSQLRQAQRFGMEITGVVDFIRFGFSRLNALSLLPFLGLNLLAVCIPSNRFRRLSFSVLVFTGLVLLSAIFTKAGPERVYLGLYPPVIIVSAAALHEILGAFGKMRLAFPLYLLFSIFPIFTFQSQIRHFSSPDWGILAEKLIREIPPQVYVIYAVGDGYPVRFNCPEVMEDLARRLAFPEKTGILQVNLPGTLEAADRRGEVVNMSMESNAGKSLTTDDGVPLGFYDLRPLAPESEASGKELLLMVSFTPEELYEKWTAILFGNQEQWHIINLFLSDKFIASDGSQHRTLALICPSAKYNATYYLKFSEESGGRFRFYQFVPKQ